MKSALRFVPILISTFLAGCGNSTRPSSDSGPDAGQSAPTNNDRNPALRDRIAGLSRTDANELSAFLIHIHGIVPAGQPRVGEDEKRPKYTFDDEIVALGDEIASLPPAESASLVDYLSSTHEIEPEE